MSKRLFLGVVLSAAAAAAQSFTPVREQQNLSPEALTKLRALESLNALPPGEWRFHAGDLPHGESVTLDDSSWPLVKPGTSAPNEAVWYRREIEIPRTLNGYDLTGERVVVPVPCRRQRPHARDHLLQRAPGRPGR